MAQVVEVDEVGRLTLTEEVIGRVPPHTRYVAEPVGESIVLRRADVPLGIPVEPVGGTDYMARWDDLAEKVGRAWHSDLTAAEAVSEMRR